MGRAPVADERGRIEQLLAEVGGNQSLAAAQLGISRSTLIRRIKELGISRPRKR
ncbi:MAG TPA: helix-turn-helix domain-containing protein [Myxococcota bacterium]|nr:helix-turn-helix domain-containing protein [Myxococcota bacterium]